MAKLNLKATSRGDSEYSAFTSGYRSSSNIEDRRVDRTQARKTSGGTNGQYGGTSGGGTGRARNNESTPDDYGFGPAEGGPSAYTTPDVKASQARKSDPEDAIDITSNRR